MLSTLAIYHGLIRLFQCRRHRRTITNHHFGIRLISSLTTPMTLPAFNTHFNFSDVNSQWLTAHLGVSRLLIIDDHISQD